MTHARETLSVPAIDVLRRLPAIGKLMITANHLGVTHERIGVVETVATDGGWAIISGTEHDSRIELGAIDSVVIDRTSTMKEKVYPHIELLRADGSEICHVVGFEGLEPFDGALAVLGAGTALEPKTKGEPGERGEAGEDDPALVRFETARLEGEPVVLAFHRPGFQQKWSGVIDAVKPAMGFVNVMRADFHLHIKARAIAGWRDDGHAVNADGVATGLSIEAR